MDTIKKRIKYKYLAPFLIKSSNLISGNKSNKTNEIQPELNTFFIQSAGRSGSTLLAMLLNRHTKIFLPPEQFALPFSIMSWHLSCFKSWETFVKEQINFYHNSSQNWELNENDISNLIKNISNFDRSFQNPVNIYKYLVQYYSQKLTDSSPTLIGDHSPNSTVYSNIIQNEFKNSKYIFVLRNPLDVILSYSKIQQNPASNYKYAIWKWNNNINAYEKLKNSNKKALLIKYEDLVNKPGKIIENVLLFLDVNIEDLIIKSDNNFNAKMFDTNKKQHHQNLYKPISNKSVNKWKEELTKKKVNKIRPLILKNAIKYGYEF